MDSSLSTPSLDTLRTVDFPNAFRGYNVDEVDNFLDKAAEELDALKDQYRQAQAQLRWASDRIKQLEAESKNDTAQTPKVSPPAPAATPAPTPAPAPVASAPMATQQVSEMIAMAEEFVSKAKEEAVTKATALTTAAQEQARVILQEAKSNALDEVTQLEGRKARLTEEVTTLARFVASERARLKSLLGEFGSWLDSSLAIRESSAPETPAAAAATPAPAAPIAQAPAPTTPSEPNRVTTIGEATQFKINLD